MNLEDFQNYLDTLYLPNTSPRISEQPCLYLPFAVIGNTCLAGTLFFVPYFDCRAPNDVGDHFVFDVTAALD